MYVSEVDIGLEVCKLEDAMWKLKKKKMYRKGDFICNLFIIYKGKQQEVTVVPWKRF